MSDLISRQAVINAFNTNNDELVVAGKENADSVEKYLNKVIDKIKALSSEQLEIIRCKDCRWGRKACGNIECFVDLNVPPEYHGYEWYCPNGERRTDE